MISAYVRLYVRPLRIHNPARVSGETLQDGRTGAEFRPLVEYRAEPAGYGSAAAPEDGRTPSRPPDLGDYPSLDEGPRQGTQAHKRPRRDGRDLPHVPRCLRAAACIVPANAFYEWQARDDAPKQPYAIARSDGEMLAFAGMWEVWRGPGGDILRTFATIVTAANEDLAPIHHRMPVILEQRDWPAWLGEQEADPAELVRPAEAGTVRIWPVSTRVNKPANNDAALLEPIG